MSKTAKVKRREPSIHSRAARRAGSPSLNTDKSLKNATPPSVNPHTHIFTAKNAGVRKRKKKQMTRGQLVRQKKGVQRADVVKERLDSKLEKSLDKLKTIKERARNWEVLNGEAVKKDTQMGRTVSMEDKPEEASWEDVEEVEQERSEGMIEGVTPREPGLTLELPHRTSQNLPGAIETTEEIDDIL